MRRQRMPAGLKLDSKVLIRDTSCVVANTIAGIMSVCLSLCVQAGCVNWTIERCSLCVCGCNRQLHAGLAVRTVPSACPTAI